MAAWMLPVLLILLAGASRNAVAGRSLAPAEEIPTSSPDAEPTANRA